MNHWLMKSEAEVYSIDDLKRDKVTPWEGVRNFAARNHMQQMKVGDMVFIYHSNASAGIVGLAKVGAVAHPDLSQFDSTGDYFEPRATMEKPIWFCVDLKYVQTFKKGMLLADIKNDRVLSDMILVKRSRLSVQPVSQKDFNYILERV